MSNKRIYFIRILITSLLILVIPTLILGVLFYREFLIKFQHRITDSYVNQIERFIDDNANDLLVLNQLVVRISNKSELTRYQLSIGGVYNRVGVEVINDYKLSNPFIDEIFLYYSESDVVFNSKGMFMQNYLPLVYIGIDNFISEYARKVQDSPGRRILGPAKIESSLLNTDRFIVLACSIPPESNTSMGTLFFLISEQDFWKPLENFDNVDIVLRSLNGDFVSSFSSIDTLSKYGHSYLEIVQSDTQNLLQYDIRIDLDILSQIVSPRRIAFYLIMAATVVLGITISIALSLFNYRPVDKLVRHNEHLQERLTDIITENNIHTRQKLLLRLINSKNEVMHKSELEMAGLRLDYPWFFVAVVYADPIDKILLHSFLEFELVESVGYGVELEEGNLIALIVCCAHDSLDIQIELQRHICDTPNSSGNRSSQKKIACGSFVSKLTDISSSFYEAAFKLEREEFTTNEVNKKNETCFADPFPAEELNLLTLAVKCGDIKRATEIVEAITERMERFFFSIFRIKMICLEIGYHLLVVLEDMGLDRAQFQDGIFYFTGIEQWKENVERILSQTKISIDLLKRQETERAQNEMILFINDNYHRFNFSLETLADHFHCSSSYASKQIKKCLGQSFSEYIFSLRSNKVKRDLSTKEKTIQEIIHDAGYGDASNFIRKFRRKEGITPGQYRQILLNGKKKIGA